MVIIRDSFQVEIEMEQKMSPISKKMHDDYYECRVQIRLYMYSKEDIERKLTPIQQSYVLDQNKHYQTVYSNKDIKYNSISISDYDLIYFKLQYILRNTSMLINKIESHQDGIDIYLANINDIHKLKRVISEHFFAVYTHSKKIMGRNHLKSKDLYRHSLLVAIYNLSTNDKIKVKGEEYTIKSIQKHQLICIHTKTLHKEVLHFNTIKDYLYKVD